MAMFLLLDLFGRSGTTLLKSSCLHALVKLFRHDKFLTNDFDKLMKRTLMKISSFSMTVFRIACLVLYYMGYVGTCCRIGYGFLEVRNP